MTYTPLKKYSEVSCLGYQIFSGNLEELSIKDRILINTINQYSYCIAEQDAEFKTALANSDVLLPDGVGITFASKFLNNKKIGKIAGADIHEFLLKKLNKEHGSCFYLGASNETLAKIQDKIKLEYPNIRVGSFSPAFKPTFTAADTKIMVAAANDFKPDVLFVGMTAPKQEKWSYANKVQLNAGLICSIGAVFDFYAGTVTRPSKIWIDSGLEWLGRFIKEPKRMWRRYIYYGVIYVGYLLKKKVGIK